MTRIQFQAAFRHFALLVGAVSLWATSLAHALNIETSNTVFERVTLSVEGPQSDERADLNPFSDIRLDWIISKGEQEWIVPGYFAACGNAANTGCTSGNIWRAHFIPPEKGDYQWKTRFKKGADIAVLRPSGEALDNDGLAGTFSITADSKNPIKARGILSYTGEKYYRYSGNNSLFFKFGPDAPENMLAYNEYDATPNFKDFRKNWSAHEKDFGPAGKPFLWQESKGKGILGKFEYLAESGANSVSMLLWNTGGDDRNVFPHLLAVDEDSYVKMKPKDQWATGTVQDRFDVSKLDQWLNTFLYADSLGIHLHFKLQETENNLFMDDGALGRTRKLYTREMIARFGHMLALSWNIGEENVQHPGDIRHIINYIASYNIYNHPVVLHSYPDQKERYRPFLGDVTRLNGLSLQGRQDDYSDLRDDVVTWANIVELSGKNLVLSYDEPGRADGGATVDRDYPDSLLPSKREVLRLPGIQGKFSVDWYDRLNGGELQKGSRPFVLGGASSITDRNRRRQGPSFAELGTPPSEGSGDWVVLVERSSSNDIRVEAESFASQRLTNKRKWCRSDECPSSWQAFETENSGYTAIIPDTRLTHDDALIRGENFSGQAGDMSVASYKVEFPMAGRWYVWVRTFSRGSEDNSVHVGLNGQWPESGARMQFCPGRNQKKALTLLIIGTNLSLPHNAQNLLLLR